MPWHATLPVSANLFDFVSPRYVDAHRGISVQLGGEITDLKAAMDKSGLCTSTNTERQPGQPNDEMYLKQAEHLVQIFPILNTVKLGYNELGYNEYLVNSEQNKIFGWFKYV